MTHADHDVEQVVGVIARPRTARQHEIVARPLALGAQPTRRGPHERMEPIERASNAAKGMTNEIAPLHVRELVKEHGAAAAIVPLLGARRQHDRRFDDAARERHLDEWAREESRHRVEIESVRDLAEWRRPGALVEDASRLDDAMHGQRAEGKPAE